MSEKGRREHTREGERQIYVTLPHRIVHEARCHRANPLILILLAIDAYGAVKSCLTWFNNYSNVLGSWSE